MSIDGGSSWSSLNLNMPAVPVHDILIHPRDNDLIVGTHGRSIWVLDNIGALEALTPDALTADAFLVPPSRARLLSIYTPQAWYGAGQFFAPNPDFGASIDFYLRRTPGSEVAVTIADARGATARTLKVLPRAGMNRVSWDLRIEPPFVEGPRESPPQGPLVLPGVYTVTVQPGGTDAALLKGTLRVDGDPRTTFPDADRRTRQATLLKLYDVQKSLAALRSASATARVASDSQLGPLQAEVAAEINAASALSRAIEGFSGLPTTDQRRQVDWLLEDAARTVSALNRVLHAETPALPRPDEQE